MTPSASSPTLIPTLILAHPTPLEIHRTEALSSISWAGALTKEQHIENETQLASYLANGNGIRHWILTQSQLSPDHRPILASCETIPKRCLIKDRGGDVREGMVHGVAGVFCDPEYRGRGYASRMLEKLAVLLEGRRTEARLGVLKGVGSVLWSDIGPKFYADLGWAPFPSNHVEIPATRHSLGLPKVATRAILAEDIDKLCAEDEALLRGSMAATSTSKTLFAIVPDHHTMLWHHKKEEYVCQQIFEKQPDIKGAVAGKPGNRVWAIWTRTLYCALEDLDAGNRLYILRLVVENATTEEQGERMEQLKAIFEAAQDEAAEWKLGHVELWNPDEKVMSLIERCGIENRKVQRDNEGIPSLLWFGDASADRNKIEWVSSEKFSWC